MEPQSIQAHRGAKQDSDGCANAVDQMFSRTGGGLVVENVYCSHEVGGRPALANRGWVTPQHSPHCPSGTKYIIQQVFRQGGDQSGVGETVFVSPAGKADYIAGFLASI